MRKHGLAGVSSLRRHHDNEDEMSLSHALRVMGPLWETHRYLLWARAVEQELTQLAAHPIVLGRKNATPCVAGSIAPGLTPTSLSNAGRHREG